MALVADAGLGRRQRSLFAVTGTWLNGYSMVLFSVHMAQHMVLSLITPLLLLIAAPVTLYRTLPRGRRARRAPRALLLEALHSRFARAVTHPLFTVPLFIASLYGVYFTPLFDALMGNPIGHQSCSPTSSSPGCCSSARSWARTRGRGR